jgi:hypothetical protein
MRIQHLLVFIAFSISAQNKPLEIKIAYINSQDSSEFLDREFTIIYHIENLTNREVSFFLNTKSLIASTFSSMQYKPTYLLFQDNNPIEVSQLITPRRSPARFIGSTQKAQTELRNINNDSIKLVIQKWKADSLYFWKKKNKDLLKAIFTLKPKEIKQFTYKLYWNKIRYTKNEDLEYYLDEKSIYSLQIGLTLLKKEYGDRLYPTELKAILDNPNFIEGYFSSNKVEINFKE